ncbi:redox-sensing transcriptional repressor Rex [Dehalobacter restrictus]|uniref:Redox-sensing transcriptional repressor Rex n=1 Tax=Dehalobacter restrictus (strain DSM 9455 / PER-K23) TaxID=871738 RepID=A0ABN4BTG1_DEHRP|nr:redox-sensing transcriptional repressor Rex [Dehalobacter restrictus]AHF10701.1 REX family transcriptional regulator [Dehalobacter restrictus DSM 9455]
MDEKKLSSQVVKRLPRYYRYLSTLLQLGISRISSKDLGNRMGLTSSQVRQDFFCFGGNGLQGYGYDVGFLHQEIHKLLGLQHSHTMIIIGAGSLGHALAKHANFEKSGFKLAGIFDVKPELIGEKIRNVEVQPVDDLPDFLSKNPVDIAVLTVPENCAGEVARLVADLGVKALWNFSPVELMMPEDIIVENTHMIDCLMVLGYNLQEKSLREESLKEKP